MAFASTSTESSNFILNLIILLIAFFIDGAILFKAMKEISVEAKADKSGSVIRNAFKYSGKASPATRLVFYEDLVATSGALLAIIGIILAQYFGILEADGIASIIIGCFMLFVAFRVGYDNMVGLIGVSAPAEVKDKMTAIIMNDPDVVDIRSIQMIQEGRLYHLEGIIELRKGLTLNEADDILERVRNVLLRQSEIAAVLLGIVETDEIQND